MNRSIYDPAVYTVRVRGYVEPYWEAELSMQISYHHTGDGGITLLMGRLPDQAALLGILGRLDMWGYEIIGFTTALLEA